MPYVQARQTVCIDWDGVMNNYVGHVEGHIYPVNPAAVDFIKKLKKVGFRVVILSAARLADIERALHDIGMEDLPDLITNVKIPAIAYIDDRAITFRGNFDETYSELMNFRTYWEDDEHQENHGLTDENLQKTA